CPQKCERCGRAGATIPCRAAAGCSRLYHFPCAATSGCFQSTKTLRLLCPEHVAEALETGDARCHVCARPGDLQDLVLCTGCGQHFHGACLDLALTPHKRLGWQCPECRVCQTCRQPARDFTMLVCKACDKGYHTFCVDPASQGLTASPWKCKNCRVCSEGGQCPVGLDSNSDLSQGSAVCGGCQGVRAAADAPVAPGHSPPSPQPDSPDQMLEPPSHSESTDVPVPPPELEPVAGDEEIQSLPDPQEAPPDAKEAPSDPKEAALDPREAPPGNDGSPGQPTPVEVPPSEEPSDEQPPDDLPLDKPPPNIQSPDVQPPSIEPPDVQPL
ncbi:KMT2D methyltransferase, partial [Grallaria varia]|nr:KMT2D methyltransferase [Grallaria varia]